MLDIGPGELLALAIIALLVLGPDKLPRYAAEASRFLRQLRHIVNNARAEVQREIGPELDNLSLAELNPRNLVRKHLLDPTDDLDLGLDDSSRRSTNSSNGPAGSNSPNGDNSGAGSSAPNGSVRESAAAPPPYDADAT